MCICQTDLELKGSYAFCCFVILVQFSIKIIQHQPNKSKCLSVLTLNSHVVFCLGYSYYIFKKV